MKLNMKLQYSFSATKNAIFSIVFSVDQYLLVCKMTVYLMGKYGHSKGLFMDGRKSAVIPYFTSRRKQNY